MNNRTQRLKEKLRIDKYPICVEKARLTTESFMQTEGEAQILRRAKSLEHVLNNITIFIEADELIVGNVASKPMGLEICPEYGIWSEDEVKGLTDDRFNVSDKDKREILKINEYWQGRTMVGTKRRGELFDDKRLWPFLQSQVEYPYWKSKTAGSGGGYAQGGMGLGPGLYTFCVDYAKVINNGLAQIIRDAEEELDRIKFNEIESIEKAYFLKSIIIANKAVIRFANRFANLAAEMALNEQDAKRKKELERIAEICRQVPAEPARNFYEAMQSFWFTFLMVTPSPTASMGRLDQYMYPFYQKDKAEGKISEEEALELLQCLRIKDMQINRISGKINRQKNAGMAKWHNCIIGGVTPEGEDATNDMSYLILEAAMRCRTPHHTITLRVHDKTPDALMLKSLELVRTGIGMPAFIGDKSYINFLLSNNVPLKTARDYVVSGCIETAVVGQSRSYGQHGGLIMPLILDVALHNGVNPHTGCQVGLKTGEVDNFKTIDDLINSFKKQLNYFVSLSAECNNIGLQVSQQLTPEPFLSSLMVNAITAGKDMLQRKLLYEDAAVINPVGMINVADSIAAIKKLVFNERKISMQELRAALDANWEGDKYQKIRNLCLAAPKFGNNIDAVDLIAADLYKFLSDTAAQYCTILSGKHIVAAISISTHGPAGELTGATADGRYAGVALADGAVSPAQGKDVNGPTAIMKSALKMDQTGYRSVLLNMKFHPSALKTSEDLLKLASLIRTYFSMGGKHVQFNVVGKDALIEAQKAPEQNGDLIVRVAGYSAYFVQLGKIIQDEVISRTEIDKMK